ncbi:rhodanese-like domain-containing protein [Dictyobacter formicarum]|uniref:rhodanese-like domain-containing protein n=1 Tax=Dictyobacter formicarum TaxID=2778368 RepID=UPI001916580B|nr:rhodanese-like domain-containing protein [Dictyobacter formicarum]
MRTIDHQELKQKMDHQASFRLVMALNEWQYQTKRIPGSLYFATIQKALAELRKEDEIVVYCSDRTCVASAALGKLLEYQGYAHVLHFAGGLAEWEQAGYPLEGRDVPV